MGRNGTILQGGVSGVICFLAGWVWESCVDSEAADRCPGQTSGDGHAPVGQANHQVQGKQPGQEVFHNNKNRCSIKAIGWRHYGWKR